MELDDIELIYLRSLERHNLRYRPIIGDGDSSSYSKKYGQYYVITEDTRETLVTTTVWKENSLGVRANDMKLSTQLRIDL